MKKYISVSEPIECGYVWTYVFDTGEEAAEDAQLMWDCLTQEGQAKRHCYSAVVYAKDCYVNEDGNIDWTIYDCCDDYPGCFDSNPNRMKWRQADNPKR